jgi:hypothetical protein
MLSSLWVVVRLLPTTPAKQLQRGMMLAIAALLCGVHVACSCDRPGDPVTGKDEQTSAAEQSETAMSVQGLGDQRVITVSYNDTSGNNGKIVYTPTQRTVFAGASMMGWSYSTSGGNSWTYGGKVAPSQDWPILWGDPALTASRTRANIAFLANLAVPKSKYPGPQGVIATLNSNGFVSAVGGACIARSTDSGKSFALYQCVSRPSFDFYDGGSMAAGPNGDIYAAFLDYITSQIDIWHSPDENGTFSMMSNPFPGQLAVNHPRLRVALDGTLYAATRNSSGDVIVNRFVNGNWGLPKAACHNVLWYPLVTLSDRSLRTGPQFSFDVGAPSVIGNDEVRFVCTTRDPQTQRLFLEASFCRADLSTGCLDAPGWSTSTQNSSGYRADQFNPLVEAFPGFFFGIPPIWKVSFLSRENDPGGNKVSVQQGNLAVLDDPVPANRKRIFLEFDFVTQQVVCPDNRGYWGDYDDLRVFEIKDGDAHFIRAETDSTAGCTKRWDTNSEQVHVSSRTTF